MRINGGCHCGHIRYRATVDPGRVAICHCTDCQTLSGSAFRTVVPSDPGSFELLAGEPRIYVKTADSGNRRAQAFCPECGTPIYSAAETEPAWFSLRVGTIVQRAELRPRRQLFAHSARDWVDDIGSIPRVDTAT